MPPPREKHMSVDRLKDAYIEALDLDGAVIDWDSLEYRSIEQWDSVAHMELVAEIEEAFGIMLDTEDVLALSSFKEAIRILTNYGVSFDG